MFKQFALTAVLVIASTASTAQSAKNPSGNSKDNGKPEELLAGTEANKAIARLGDLSPVAIREHLQQMRQPAYLPTPLLISKIVEAQHLPIASGKRIDQLKAALQPVLDYHERGQMPVYVLWSEQPKAYLVAQAVIFLTTRLMMSASDEEIRGIVAHELAHDYIWEERKRALKANNWNLLWDCELFCDAIAAFTLKEIGDDPASYGRSLALLARIGIQTGNENRPASLTHPSLDMRLKLNKFLCKRLD